MAVVGVWKFYQDVYDVYQEKDRQSRFPFTAISLSNWHKKNNNLNASKLLIVWGMVNTAKLHGLSGKASEVKMRGTNIQVSE